MEEKILQFVEEKKYVTANEIYAFFDDKRSRISLALQTMVNDGRLIIEDDYYVAPETLGILLAEITSIKENYAFAHLLRTDEDVYLKNDDLADAILHDRVYLRPNNYGFHVVKIVQRKHLQIVGEVYRSHGQWLLNAPYLAPEGISFVIENYQGEESDLVVGHIISSSPQKIIVAVDSILGKKNDPGMDMKRLLLENDAPVDFPDDVEREVIDIPLIVKNEEIVQRLDLRQELIFTIDGEDARDLDDAISIKKENDSYLIGVHIADVSYYVHEKSAIDEEAFNRGTSIYIADRVVPMLPFQLSNGICSLNPDVDRLTISCLMKVNEDGEVLSYEIVPAVICSKHRLTYTYVNEVLAQEKANNELEESLQLLHRITAKIRQSRTEKGALELSVPEIKIVVDQEGKAIGVVKKEQKEGEKLIEDLMILANEIVATTINRKSLPFLYRIHEKPPLRKLEQFIEFASRLGHPIAFNPLQVTSKDLQNYLSQLQGVEEKEIISTVLLRSLAKARYASTNKGHFGLASSCYTHFTSPIRRYPDLIVHRLLRKYLFQKDFTGLNAISEQMVFLAEDTSYKERRAVAIERSSVDIKGAEYMENHLGMVLNGYIDGMNNRAMYVALENGLSGILKFSDFHEYFTIDENGQSSFSRRRGIRFILGEKVKVMVASVDKMKGEIVLELIEKSRYRPNPQHLRLHRRK